MAAAAHHHASRDFTDHHRRTTRTATGREGEGGAAIPITGTTAVFFRDVVKVIAVAWTCAWVGSVLCGADVGSLDTAQSSALVAAAGAFGWVVALVGYDLVAPPRSAYPSGEASGDDATISVVEVTARKGGSSEAALSTGRQQWLHNSRTTVSPARLSSFGVAVFLATAAWLGAAFHPLDWEGRLWHHPWSTSALCVVAALLLPIGARIAAWVDPPTRSRAT